MRATNCSIAGADTGVDRAAVPYLHRSGVLDRLTLTLLAHCNVGKYSDLTNLSILLVLNTMISHVLLLRNIQLFQLAGLH